MTLTKTSRSSGDLLVELTAAATGADRAAIVVGLAHHESAPVFYEGATEKQLLAAHAKLVTLVQRGGVPLGIMRYVQETGEVSYRLFEEFDESAEAETTMQRTLDAMAGILRVQGQEVASTLEKVH